MNILRAAEQLRDEAGNPTATLAIIHEMRKVSEILIQAAGEGHQIDLARLTVIIDGWRFSLEKQGMA